MCHALEYYPMNQTGILGELYRPLQRSSATCCGRGDLRAVVARRQWQQSSIAPSAWWCNIWPCIRRVHAPLQAHPCVEACRACVSALLYNSCLIEQSTSCTVHSHFFSRRFSWRQAGGGSKTVNIRPRQAICFFKDIILACPASAIIQLLPHVRLQE